MIERRPLLTILRHVVLIVGVGIVMFPIYVAFVASTLSLDEVLTVPMQLWPGHPLRRELRRGARARQRSAVRRRRSAR